MAMNWALIIVEDGDPSFDSIGGPWATEEARKHIDEGYEAEFLCCEEQLVLDLIGLCLAGLTKYNVFYVIVFNPRLHQEPMSNTSHPFDPGYIWLEYDSIAVAVYDSAGWLSVYNPED